MVIKKLSIPVSFNGHSFSELQISGHYKESHAEITLNEIESLVYGLRGRTVSPHESKGGFTYFASEPEYLGNKAYRLVWLIPDDLSFIGIVNVFRVRKYDKKKK